MKINWGMVMLILGVFLFIGVVIMVCLHQDKIRKQKVGFCEDYEGKYIDGGWGKSYCDIKENGIYQRYIVEGERFVEGKKEEMYLVKQ